MKVVKGSKGVHADLCQHLPHCATRYSLSGSHHKFRASLRMKGRTYYVGDIRFEASHHIFLGVSAPQIESVERVQRGAYIGDGQLCYTSLMMASPLRVPKVWEVVDNEQVWRARTENQS